MPSATTKVPIPPPSHPRQYRAIGLIQGQYRHSADKITRGKLTQADGTTIEAVILGKMISLFKKHIDLEKPHLWVVYPRIRQTNDQLHLQIAGVWEPETLDKNAATQKDSFMASPQDSESTAATIPIKSGYFSIRGEVVYSSRERNTVIVKIRQSPKHPTEKPKFFKLSLKGQLPDKSLGHFWDLQVQLCGDILTIQTGTDLGYIPKKKPVFRHQQKTEHKLRPQKPLKNGDRSSPLEKTLDRPVSSPRRLPKPKKKPRSESS